MNQSHETNETELDDETIAAINEAEAQGDRGEGMEIDEVRRLTRASRPSPKAD